MGVFCLSDCFLWVSFERAGSWGGGGGRGPGIEVEGIVFSEGKGVG